MKTSEFIESRVDRTRVVARELKLSLCTERTYCGWVRRFVRFSLAQSHWEKTPPEEMARRFVQVQGERWSVATQDQFRNALVFYYRHVLERPIGNLGEWAQARRPEKLPVWLPHEEMMSLLSHLRGTPRLMARIGYGSGLRSRELASLRWGNIDFHSKTITVRGGKGGKDRVTFLPESEIEELKQHMGWARELYQTDRRAGRAGVEVPSEKFNGKDWQWFWVWPALNESRDPRSGIVRRHHLHRDTLGKALKAAVQRWGGNQRVTQHSLRHSFATELLTRGVGIQVVQELLGHSNIETTQIYAHVLPRKAVVQARSPLDGVPANVTAMPSREVVKFPILRTA
jgi:integron integrase